MLLPSPHFILAFPSSVPPPTSSFGYNPIRYPLILECSDPVGCSEFLIGF